jgi:hypothetical protein
LVISGLATTATVTVPEVPLLLLALVPPVPLVPPPEQAASVTAAAKPTAATTPRFNRGYFMNEPHPGFRN